MRYLVQFVVPVLVFAAVVYLLGRRRHPARRGEAAGAARDSDTGPFLVILALGAAVAIVVAFALQAGWG